MLFFTELATNATQHGVHIITYVGNDDGISPHFGTEVTIQVCCTLSPLQSANICYLAEYHFRRHPGLYPQA